MPPADVAAQLAAFALPASPATGAGTAAAPGGQQAGGGLRRAVRRGSSRTLRGVGAGEAAAGAASAGAAQAAPAPPPTYLHMCSFVEAWQPPATLAEQLRLVCCPQPQPGAGAHWQQPGTQLLSVAEPVGCNVASARLAAFHVRLPAGVAPTVAAPHVSQTGRQPAALTGLPACRADGPAPLPPFGCAQARLASATQAELQDRLGKLERYDPGQGGLLPRLRQVLQGVHADAQVGWGRRSGGWQRLTMPGSKAGW